MALPPFLLNVTDWLRTQTQMSSELAGFALGAGVLLAIILLFWVGRWVVRSLNVVASAISTKSKSRKAATGYRVLIAPPTGTSRSAFKFLLGAAEERVSPFSFDAPIQVFGTAKIIGGRDAQSEKVARKRLERANADMIVWGERVGRGVDGLNIFSLSRAGGLTADEAVLQHFALPSSAKQRDDRVQQVAGFLLAKRLQPSLGRPTDFRAERLLPVASQLSELLDTAKQLSHRVQHEVERDFSAAAIHVGEAESEAAWLDKVIALRNETLSRLGNFPQPGIWAEAKLDLGRAMISKASMRFNPALVTEGSNHLREAIEVLKADPMIRRAEDAMGTLETARNLTANRNRFSINFNA